MKTATILSPPSVYSSPINYQKGHKAPLDIGDLMRGPKAPKDISDLLSPSRFSERSLDFSFLDEGTQCGDSPASDQRYLSIKAPVCQ